ncbi:MAG: hypothetical protein Q9190_005601, partial [Brigantiaea leucoxantha]
MPRVTRAALRSQASIEGSDIATMVPLPASPAPMRRSPLGEISGNSKDGPPSTDNTQRVLPALNKGVVKGKKTKSSRMAEEMTASLYDENNDKIVLMDDCESEASSAVEEACRDLLESSDQ